MSSTRALKIVSIFVAAFLFGLAWVGIFRFVHVNLFKQNAKEAKTVAVKPPVTKTEPILSMDDPSFTPPQVDESNPDKFDPEGIYTAEGLDGEAFRDFEMFSISNKKLDVDCDAKDFGILIAPTGAVLETSAQSTAPEERPLNFNKIRISDGKLAFATESVGGTSYEFEGTFLVKGNFYTLDPEARVLQGILSKFQNGIKVAETEVSFTWSIDLTCVC